jgi:hypothetical protein
MAFLFLDKKNIIFGAIVLAIMFSLGVIIGYFGKDNSAGSGSNAEALVNKIMGDQFKDEQDLVKQALEDVNTDNLRSYLKTLTKEPHIAGLKRDNELIQWIRQSWLDMGLDRVELAEYDFYLSWPNQVIFYNGWVIKSFLSIKFH